MVLRDLFCINHQLFSSLGIGIVKYHRMPVEVELTRWVETIALIHLL